MIIEILDVAGQALKGKYMFDDEGPTMIELKLNSLCAVQWSKEGGGVMPVIPKEIMDRYHAAVKQASSVPTSLITA